MTKSTTFALLLVTAALHAQIPSAAQNSSLVGLRTVALFVVGNAADSVLRNLVALDLRKVGIKVVADSAEIDPADDGVMTLSVMRVADATRTDGELRLSVSQSVALPRTNEVGRLTTWSYNIHGRGVKDFPRWLSGARETAVEYFLTHWYYTNAR